MTDPSPDIRARVDQLAVDARSIFEHVHAHNDATGQQHPEVRQLESSLSAVLDHLGYARKHAAAYYGGKD